MEGTSFDRTTGHDGGSGVQAGFSHRPLPKMKRRSWANEEPPEI